jgi:scyllo-inositol 2-dehydrogenase (NADP+)
MEQKKTGIAVVGYGGMGSWHTRTIAAIPECTLTGTYDINPERNRIAEENGVHAYPSFEAVLADPQVDLITVAIPNDQHKDVCIQAMKAGKNVVCEKPVALSSAELQQMIDTANACGVIFTVHQNRRWDEDYRTVKGIFDKKTLGKVFRIESRVHGSRGIPGDWRNQKVHGGGMVLDWGVHMLDQMTQMMGKRKIKTIFATLSNVTNEEVDDGFTAVIKFEDDIEWIVEVGTSHFIRLPRWLMLGENGSAVVEDWDLSGRITMVSDWEKRDAVPVVTAAGLTKTMAPRTEDTIRNYPLPIVRADIHDFYRNVGAAIRGEEEQIVRHDELQRVMRIMEAIFESAEQQKVVIFNG